MVRKAMVLPVTDQARLMHRGLLLEGMKPGDEIPRDIWEDMMIAVFKVGHRNSIATKTRVGVALRLWRVTEAHGKGGRGYITLLDPAAAFRQGAPS